MKRISTSPDSSRCAFTKANGHRCRMLPAPDSTFCPTHIPKPDPAAALVRDLDQFQTAGDVTIFLSRLLAGVSKGEVSTRRASVLAYISISLMQALRSMASEAGLDNDGSDYDPLPLAWTIMAPGYAPWVNIHDARAFFAQRRANQLREAAKASFEETGETSAYYPYTNTEPNQRTPKPEPEPEPEPDSPGSAYVRFSRLSS
ncbi:MAG TPA: hypothetical protein VMT75_11440 [Candidatus Saccharimonadales bacterium]|nr:hypothetical protein [Candidatus Saccharimonadales bacterium]